MFNTVEARAAELGGSATMLTEFGECTPYFDHPDYQGITDTPSKYNMDDNNDVRKC